MKKRFYLPVIVIMILVLTSLPVFAFDVARPSYVSDAAGILSQQDAAEAEAMLESVSQDQSADIVFATVQNTTENSLDLQAEKMYRGGGYGRGDQHDGMLLLLSMENSDWAIYAHGYCQKAVGSDGLNALMENVIPKLKEGDFKGAVNVYGASAAALLSMAKAGTPYKAPYRPGKRIVIGLVVGLIIALLVTGSMKGELNNVHKQSAAASYIKQNSMKVTLSNETYLYKKVDRTQKAQTNTNAAAAGGAAKSASGKF